MTGLLGMVNFESVKFKNSQIMTKGLLLLLLALSFFNALSQVSQTGDKPRTHFVSSSLFMMANFFPESPNYYQLNYGIRLRPKDALIFEAITWEYRAPLGIPYGKSFRKEEENFPGIVRDFGVGFAYQRFWWKKLYTTVHAAPFLQQYLTPEREKIQTGFQLFLVGRVGYHIKLLKSRQLFFEPSIAFTYWPVNTNMPELFAAMENKWPNYFLFEPGLHIGFNF